MVFYRMYLKVTDSAFGRIAELIKLENKTDLLLRISVDGGGCSGFRYNYELVPFATISNDDLVIENDNSKVVVDSISRGFMEGCIVDFVEQLGNSYFEIKNPNATGKCGCGNSFSI